MCECGGGTEKVHQSPRKKPVTDQMKKPKQDPERDLSDKIKAGKLQK